METGMTDKRQGRHTEHLRTKIAAGYILIFLLVGGIVHLWVDEWRKLETFETENHRINALRMEVHDVYVRVVELSCSARPYWNGRWRTWRNTGTSGRRWTAYSAASKTSTLRSVSTAMRRLLEDRRSNCAASCVCLTSRRTSMKGLPSVCLSSHGRVRRKSRRKRSARDCSGYSARGKAGTDRHNHHALHAQP